MRWFIAALFGVGMVTSGCMSTPDSDGLDVSELNNTFAKLENGQPVQIVVIGNSVTHGAPAGEKRTTSFYWALYDWLREHYPKGDIRLQTSIMFAIGPELQLFRMDDKVFQYKPDIVIAEFGAANGAWGERGRKVTDPATEGYLRRLREKQPECDIVLQLGLFKTMMKYHETGEVPPTAAYLHKLASHYDCLISDGQKALADRMLAGAEWKSLMKDGIHPGPAGYAVHSAVLRAALDKSYADYKKNPQPVKPHALPAKTTDPNPWQHPRLVPVDTATDVEGFVKQDFGRFKGLVAGKTNAVLTFRPKQGRCVGLFLRRPKSMGRLQVKHGDKWVELDLKHEPVSLEENDPDKNRIIRHFFHADGLPVAWDEVTLRTVIEPDQKKPETIQLLGFLVVDDVN